MILCSSSMLSSALDGVTRMKCCSPRIARSLNTSSPSSFGKAKISFNLTDLSNCSPRAVVRGIRGYFLSAPEAFKGSTVKPDEEEEDCCCCCCLRSAIVVDPFACPLGVAIEGILVDSRRERVKERREREKVRISLPLFVRVPK